MAGPEVKSSRDTARPLANSKSQDGSLAKKASSLFGGSGGANTGPSKVRAGAQKDASELQTKRGAGATHNKYSAADNGKKSLKPFGGAKIQASKETNDFDVLPSTDGMQRSSAHGLEGLNINGDVERTPSLERAASGSSKQGESGINLSQESRPQSRPSDPMLRQHPAWNVQEETEEDMILFEEQIESMILGIMGPEESYGYKSTIRAESEILSFADNVIPGMIDEGNGDTLTKSSDVVKQKARVVGKLASALKTKDHSLENGKDLLPFADHPEYNGDMPSKQKNGQMNGQINGHKPPRMFRSVSFLRTSSNQDQTSADNHWWEFDLFVYLSGLLQRLYRRLAKSLTSKDSKQTQVVSILVTPVKRLERDANKSSKRVHFKLRKKSQAQVFEPLHRSSHIVQTWYMFLVVPRCFDIFAFGIRLAFCDLYRRAVIDVWYVDIICDVWMLCNMLVSLVTVIPKHTYPNQPHAVNTLKGIANYYFRYDFVWDFGPSALYHAVSICLLLLPHTTGNDANADILLHIWFISAIPRFIMHSRALLKYAAESVVDPNITRKVKQFQFAKIVIQIAMFAHLIGCFYYFIARIYKFDNTTWIHAFEETLPYYDYKEAVPADNFLLILFKGFCRVASLGYDPGLPANLPEMILAILVMFVSVYISSLILGTLLTYLVRRDPAEVAHKERLENLRTYMEKKHVPEDLYETVIRYCEFQYKKGRSSDTSSDHELVPFLSRSLRIQVANAYHRDLMLKCSKIGRPFHRCSQGFFNDLVVKLYTVHVMPGDHVVHKDEIPRELYFVSFGAVQVVDEHDQVVSVIRSDVPDTAPIVGEVPFFLGINYLKAIKASLDGDVQLQVLSKQSSLDLAEEYPEDHNTVCENLWAQFGGQGEIDNEEADAMNLDKEKLLTKKRILEATNFKKIQQFNKLCKAARSGDSETITYLARQGANLNHTDYDGRTAMHMACIAGRYKVVECLLRLGANANIKDRWGSTPMSIAITYKQQMIITVLAASHKAKLDIADPALALCTAAGSGDLVQVKRYIDFGVSPNLGDYDHRYALHIAAAEGHEKIVEYLLFAQADPNCKDRWGGTPLQDALAGQHIGTAHILKSKGADVPESFGAGAVCEAAGMGDVPKLRMLHSFGQSLDVGDYDQRHALHLASAEGRVLAVSFLLGISSDPNKPDRWKGTPMDDCVRGGTLYHKYCAKLLQGWGGELGTFKGTKEGEKFFSSLEQISIKSIREVIRRLIAQGFDKECPVRMDDQELLATMTATVRHMPLVTQLHKNTSVITKEIKHFRTVVSTFSKQIKENIESVLVILSKGSRRVPDYEVSLMDDLQIAKRPKSSRNSGPKTRVEMNRTRDVFTGMEKEERSQILDSLTLESPAHSHSVVGMPRRMLRWLKNSQQNLTNTNSKGMLEETRTLSAFAPSEGASSGFSEPVLDMLSNTPQTPIDFDKEQQIAKKRRGFRQLTSNTMVNVFKRNNQRTDALMKTLWDSTIPPIQLRECARMLKKSDRHRFIWMTEASEGILDSDEEDALHAEIDRITEFMEVQATQKTEMWWEKQAARMFNNLALHITEIEHSYKLLHQILCSSLSENTRPSADPMLNMENLARALVAMQGNIHNLDLDKVVDEVHSHMKPFKLLQTPKQRRANKDEPSGQLRFSTLVAASSSFRNSILTMDVDSTLCDFMKSNLSSIFSEELGRLLLENGKRDQVKANETLFSGIKTEDHKYLIVVLSGSVTVIRTLDDVEIGRGKCTVGCYFGAHNTLRERTQLSEDEKELPVKEGGNGVNNCVISTSEACEILRIPITNLRHVLTRIRTSTREMFFDGLLEKIAMDIMNLENMNVLAMDSLPDSNQRDSSIGPIEEDWMMPMSKRQYYSTVPEISRQELHETFAGIQKLWLHLSRGADTVPKSTVELIKEFLGEGGLQCYKKVFTPMEEPTAPSFFNAETFWFCWVKFLSHFILHANRDDQVASNEQLDPDLEGEEMEGKGDLSDAQSTAFKGVITIMIKYASKLLPMDTFTGKADPYVVVSVEGMSQKSSIKSGTLEPLWNETMQFNAIANRSIVRIELFDSEAMGQDRSMGMFSFIVSPNPTSTTSKHELSGALVDGRQARGSVSISSSFLRGAKATKTIEQKSEFQLFCETENIKDRILWFLMPSRRIESAFFKVPLPVHEREYVKAVGALAVPLTGLAIKQYLTYLLVEHHHQVDIYSCREFCRFFKRKLDGETSIAYRDIVKIVKERNSGVNNKDMFIGHTFNRYHWLIATWHNLVKIVSLYHFIMVPYRIGFQPWPEFTTRAALCMDLPADIIIFSHVIVLLNTGYQNSKSQWVTSRYRIFKNLDWVVVFAVLPFDWIVNLSGMPPYSAVNFRLNKVALFFSRINPGSLMYSTRGAGISDLLVNFLIICHYATCAYFYIGENVPNLDLGKMNQVSWLHANPEVEAETYDREAHFGLRTVALGIDRYVLCFYWVLSTITCQGVTGDVVPQNFLEIIFTIALLAINLTIYRWISGEFANMVMSADDKVMRTREEQDRILQFISGKKFSSDLRERIQSHFLAVQGNVSEEQDKLLATLSHGLRVELARLIWREFLTKVYLFRGCSGQFLDAVCVLVHETHFGPEQMIENAGSISQSLYILVNGGVEAYSNESSKIKKLSRKGSTVGSLSCFFGIRQYMNTRAARQGAVFIRLSRDGLTEVMQIYPKDEERVHKNALNFYVKDKSTEGSIAFTAFSGETEADSDDSDTSAGSRGTSKSGGTTRTEESSKTGGSGSTKRSSASKQSQNSGDSRQSKERGENVKKKKSRKKAAEAANEVERKEQVLEVSDAGGASSIDADEGANEPAAPNDNPDEGDMPLLKETDHIPLIRERLLEEKIRNVLTASARGDLTTLESMFDGGDVTFGSKDSYGRTPLHVAASEGHAKLVEYLLSKKADPASKDKLGNSPFNDAVRSKHDNVVAVIKKHDRNITYKLGGNELGVLMCQAAAEGRLEDIKRLVNNGVDPNEADYDGRTAMHLAASNGNLEILEHLVGIKANFMCRDRFNGTPLEDAVRHHFDVRNAAQAQRILRSQGATLAGEGLKYVVKMCEYAAEGDAERIRLLAENGVDVSLGDYDDRTPLHLAACNGHTAVLEYLLKQETVLVNAVDRFGGTPFMDAVRHERKGAAALLEEAGCVRDSEAHSKDVLREMIERSNMKKEVRLRAEREPKIRHVLDNSQESKMVATISDKLSKQIAAQSEGVEMISQRLIWGLRGFGTRLQANDCNIPFSDRTFVKSAEHVLQLINEMRGSVNSSRSSLTAEMQGDEGASDCLIWRNASKEYKRQASDLDNQMRELILLAKVSKRMLKEVIKVCKRGSRQDMYADNHMKAIMASAMLDKNKLAQQDAGTGKEAALKREVLHIQGPQGQGSRKWVALRGAIKISASLSRTSSAASRGSGERLGGSFTTPSGDVHPHPENTEESGSSLVAADGATRGRPRVARSSSFSSLSNLVAGLSTNGVA